MATKRSKTLSVLSVLEPIKATALNRAFNDNAVRSGLVRLTTPAGLTV